MPKYLVTLTSDDFVDVKHFIGFLDKHELSEPGLHGKDLFYSTTNKHVKKGDIIIFLHKRAMKDDIHLVGYAGVAHSVQGLFFGLPGHDGKRKTYHSIIAIDPGKKVVKKVKLAKKQLTDLLKDTMDKNKLKEFSLPKLARSGAFISEKEWKKLKGLVK